MASLPQGFVLEDQAVQLPQGFVSEDKQVTQTRPAQTGIGITALQQGLQGATLGFADEIQANIGAGVAKAFGGEATKDIPFGDLVNESLETQRRDLLAQQEERPVLSIVSQLGGGLLTGGFAATRQVGRAATQRLAQAGLPTKIAAGVGVGATGGGLTGLGTAEGDIQQRLPEAAFGAALGGTVGGAIPGVVPAFKVLAPKARNAAEAAKKAIARRKINEITPINSQTVKQVATTAYKRAADLNGVLNEGFTNKVLDKIQKLSPQTTAGRILAGDSKFTKIIDDLEQLRNQPLDLASAQEIDEFLSEAVDSLLDVGRTTKQSLRVDNIQQIFRKSIDDAGVDDIVGDKEAFTSLKQARKLWAAQSRMRDVEKIIERAELMDNPQTGLKTGFRTLLLNEKKIRRFSSDERKLIKKAAKTGLETEVLRALGSRLIPIAVGSGGFVSAGLGGALIAAPAVVISAAARKGAEKIQKKKALKVLRNIQKGALE